MQRSKPPVQFALINSDIEYLYCLPIIRKRHIVVCPEEWECNPYEWTYWVSIFTCFSYFEPIIFYSFSFFVFDKCVHFIFKTILDFEIGIGIGVHNCGIGFGIWVHNRGNKIGTGIHNSRNESEIEVHNHKSELESRSIIMKLNWNWGPWS